MPEYYHCQGCDFSSESSARNNISLDYQLSTDRTVNCASRLGWCQQCEDLTEIESLSEHWLQNEEHVQADQMSACLRSIDSIISIRKKLFFGLYEFGKAKLAKLEKEKIWLEKESVRIGQLREILNHRTLGPRCLSCGSADTAPVDIDDADNLSHGFAHSCGGMLKYSWVEDDIHLSMAPRMRVFSTEGEFLEERERDEFRPG